MQDLPISSRVTLPAHDLEVSFIRSSGPGGQNVNKVNSKVRLAWSLRDDTQLPELWKQRVIKAYGSRVTTEGRLVVISQKYRDQPRNLQDARAKLREMLLACQFAPTTRKPTKPTHGSRLRRLEGKKQLSQRKQLRRSPPDAS